MWLEIKAGITLLASLFVCITIGWATWVTGSIIFLMLGTIGVITYFFGDILLGIKLINTDAINWLDPNGQGEKTVILEEIGGNVRTIKGKKRAFGKIESVLNKKKVSIIDSGRNPLRLPNGNSGILAHEDYDKDLEPVKAELLKQLYQEYKVDNSKDLYYELKKKESDLTG